jgi:hypothetical protein
VRAVAEAVNALPLAEPAGPFPACPAIALLHPFVHLTFRKRAYSAVLARVLIATEGCVRGGEATAWVATVHRHRLALTTTLAPKEKSLGDLIEAALGHRLHLR